MTRQRMRSADNPGYDPYVACSHFDPRQTFTHAPCSCGRTLWPPRGRGRGESLSSPRRINAMLRAVEVYRLRVHGEYSYDLIARRLGFRDRSGAWRAERRLLAWFNAH